MQNESFDVHSFLPYLLNQAAEISGLEFQQVYKGRYGMLRTEWRVLFHLGGRGAMTATQIGTLANIHKTKISRAVQKLAARRFLIRTPDPQDRRSERLELTPAGQAVYSDLMRVAQRYDQELLSDFSPQEAQVLRRALKKLCAKSMPRFT
jgi:DNA-binding MarR family transcriptional regulator